MTITPQGQLYLCKTPLENDYKNQLTFSNATAQLTYFNSTIQHTFSEYTYIKRENSVNVGKNIDEIIDCNYLFYRNVGFTNKYYFCFITNMEYVNENCTKIIFETDVFQTWYFDIDYHKCFVEREHVSDDTVGKHTVPENLELGDYIQQSVDSSEEASFNFFLDDNNRTPLIVLAVSETGLNVALPSGNRQYNGIYSGLIYLTFPTLADCDKYIQYIQQHITEDVIYSAFMMPYKLATAGSGFQWNSFTSGNYSFDYAFVSYSTGATYLKSASVTKPTKLDNNYTPKNKKLLTFPYCYLLVSNNAGSSHDYKYEYFKELDGSAINKCDFQIYGALSVGGSVKLYPLHYKRGDATSSHYDENYLESLDGGKLPTCGWKNDAYTNWLTGNAVNIGLSVGSDLLRIGSSAVSGNPSGAIGGLSGITGTLAQIYQHSLTPETAKGGVNQGDLNYAKQITYSVYKMSIRKEYAEIIDNYFNMFGYKVNTVKIPNITSRTNWNYVKTIDCNFTGNIPEDDMRIIKSMFNNGVTLWHNASTMFNYSNSNNIS